MVGHKSFLLFFQIFPLFTLLNLSPSGSQSPEFIERLRIGDPCDELYVCNSNDYLLTCVPDGSQRKCICNEKLSIQVDFLKYRVGRMCLLRLDVPCSHLINFESNFKLNVERIRGILLRFVDGKTSPEDRKVMRVEEMEEIQKEVNELYEQEPTETRPSSPHIYFQEYLNKYGRDAGQYLLDIGPGTPCASGNCSTHSPQIPKCMGGVNNRHQVTGQRRKFRNSALQPRIMFCHVLILNLLSHFIG